MAALETLKGERLFDFLADCIEPVANLAESQSVKELLEPKDVPEGMDAKSFAMARLKSGLPAVLRENKREIIAVLAAAEGENPEEYGRNLTLPALIHGAAELVGDKDFIDFFQSLLPTQTKRS